MSFEEVKIAILRCDESVLSSNLLGQLINYLPPTDQLTRLEALQNKYDDLPVPEQFAVTVISNNFYLILLEFSYLNNQQIVNPA